MQTDWFLWIFIKWCFYEFLHFYLSYLSINCIRSCCCWQLKMIRCHWCLFVHLSLWVLSIKLRVLLLFRQLWAVYRNTHTILLRSFVVPPRKMMFTFVTATEKTNNNNNPSRLFQLCHTRHIYGARMPFNFYLPLIYVVDFCCSWCSDYEEVFYFYRALSNCNDCLTLRPRGSQQQQPCRCRCRCRSHRKIKVRTYWHRQSLIWNVLHIHANTHRDRKRENITIVGMFIVSFPFFNIVCWQTNKQTRT